MALFRKKKAKKQPVDETAIAEEVFAEVRYREELRELGRKQFKELVATQADGLGQDIEAMMQRVATDMRAHTTRQMDALVGRLNAEITNQINNRIREYSRVSTEAQELVAQSLSRNAQMVHEKYQQMAANLQRIVADQEVMMATVFQDGKTQVSAVQSEQTRVLEQLKETEAMTRRQAEQLTQALRQTVSSQATRLNAVYQENLDQVKKTRESQDATLDSLKKTTEALEEQYQQLRELLESSVAKQKEMVTQTINDNMAQIIEHYLMGALGEQSNVRSQLPAILEYLEENKEAMVEDMRL